MSTVPSSWTAGPGEEATVQTLGGKASGLDRLGMLGVDIPRWFVITSHAMDEVLNSARTEIEHAHAPHRFDRKSMDHVAARTVSIVHSAPWPDELGHALQKRLAAIGRKARHFAVRSSAVGEDGETASHAGQFATLLGVPRAGVADAVRHVWASAFSARAALYRDARRNQQSVPRMAVIVQELIDSDVSGVMFTADPVTGAPNLTISAGYGLGEGIVSDRVPTDTYVRRIGAAEWEHTIRTKTRRVIVASQNFGGTEVAGVPAALQEKSALSDELLERLADVARRIERAAGCPQDIEWALDSAGRLFVLQARPISALPEGEPVVWDDANIGEGYPGITLPLTYSYVRHAYETVFRTALVDAGIERTKVRELHDTLANLVGHIGGRLYLNLTNYYRLFGSVPGIGSLVHQWEQGLGVSHDGTDAAALQQGRTTWPGIAALRTWCNLIWRYLRISRVVRRLRTNVLALASTESDTRPKSVEELLENLREIDRELLPRWAYHIYNDLFSFLSSKVLANLCNGDDLLYRRLLSGIRNLESMEPLRSLRDLTDVVRATPSLRALFESRTRDRRVWDAIQHEPSAAKFRARVADHLRAYGDRTVQELKLEVETPATSPWMIVGLIRSMLVTDARKVDRRDSLTAGTRDAVAALLIRHRGRPLLRLVDRLVVWRLRHALAIRETMSLARARAYGIVRRIVKQLGRALVRADALDGESDVFYLTLEEIDRYARGALPDVRSLVAQRRTLFTEYEDWVLPHRVVCRGSPGRLRFPVKPPPPRDAGSVLQGVPCSFGVARGRARVVTDVTNARPVPGEILVAPATEPGWLFLMHSAAGLVVERGSLLSHAAIVGRELGLPTVVGLERATERISTGDEIEVDGGTGLVRVLSHEPCCG